MAKRLTRKQALNRADEIREEFDKLMKRNEMASRPDALQWRFFRHCLDALLTDKSEDFPCNSAKAAQYRLEVMDRLNFYYLHRRRPSKFTFAVRHFSRALRERMVDTSYPNANGYVFLVSELTSPYFEKPERDTRALLPRVVADAVDAEFSVYKRLPHIDLSPLHGVYSTDGDGYQKIRYFVEAQRPKNVTISNANNPSTHRLMDVWGIDLQKPDEALVQTQEYWYLRWWSLERRRYGMAFSRQSINTYRLSKNCDKWLVDNKFTRPPELS